MNNNRQRTTIIIVVVVLLVLCCCCLGGLGAWWLWNNGDRLFGITGQVMPLALMAL